MFRCLFSKHARVMSTAVVMFNKLVVIFWLNVLLKLSIDRMMNKKPFEIYIVYVDIRVPWIVTFWYCLYIKLNYCTIGGRLFRVSQNLRQFYTRKSYFAIKNFHTRIDTGHNFCELITLRYANVTVLGMKKCSSTQVNKPKFQQA